MKRTDAAAGPMHACERSMRGRSGVRGADELRRDDLHGLLIAPAPCELNDPVDEGEERVVFAHADVRTGVILRAALAQDDIARDDALAAELLHAQTLALGVAPVARRAEPFLVGETLQIDDERQDETLLATDGQTRIWRSGSISNGLTSGQISATESSGSI